MSSLSPLRFEPYYKPVLWGGERIASFKGLPPHNEPIGESWEISGLEGYESKVSEGQFMGMTIDRLLSIHGEEILGQRLYNLYGNKFPLLIKFIDASKDLSVQVHPDDTLAAKRHNCWGKTELWYTLDPAPGAYLYSGLQSSITPERLKEHIANNTFSDVLAKFYPSRGDLFYLPAGRIHSIGAGNLILEIQQTSDITYRVYDYNRTDLNGKKRELHIDLALDAIDFRVHEDYMRHVDPLSNREIVLKECPFFSSSLISADNRFRLQVSRYNSFRIVIATKGNGAIADNWGNEVSIRQGNTLLIPASTRWIDIIPCSGPLEVVTAYIQ
ncbi:MAG: class I mannose-6-phosphate isomerase [Muribaculaceae bacterium]|nr:class I mannose-6-phosphate isomerase [Muribaculaceae bacterium]